MANKKQNIVITAGGTGGHIFPAYAIAELLQETYDITWVCDIKTDHFLSAARCDKSIFKLEKLAIAKNTKGIIGKTLFLISIIRNFILNIRILYCNKPCAVIGFGGWPTVPTLLAASILMIPIVLHEQNAVLGRVNRLFSRIASLIITSFENTRLIPAKQMKKVISSINPVRKAVIEYIKASITTSSSNGKAKSNTCITIGIIGGSQGSKVLNMIVPRTINSLPENVKHNLRVYHQSGSDTPSKISSIYTGIEKIIVQSFFSNISDLLTSSDIIISRAGGSIISEIILLDKQVIFIPMSASTDNHQMYNAQGVQNTRFQDAYIIEENNKTEEKLYEVLQKIISEINPQNANAKFDTVQRRMEILNNYQRKLEQLKERIDQISTQNT